MIPFSDRINRILVTGGSGFIGSNLVRKLLNETNIKIYNLDKSKYSASLCNLDKKYFNRYELLNVDLYNDIETTKAINICNPDLVFHLAAESHVDKSILEPKQFLNSNVVGTFNLLQALLLHWKSLSQSRKESFRIVHVSTDEVFGSTTDDDFFIETTRYDPRSPYSASKAASDHLVRSWNNTYGLPSIITNSSNNFGPWQIPEKLIPVIIKNALNCKSIPLYGDGKNIRDWIFVEDHVNALVQVMLKGNVGDSYCIGSRELKTNKEIVEIVCRSLDFFKNDNSPHIKFQEFVNDRPGHDQRYAIDNKKIVNELNWKPQFDFLEAIDLTVKWYLDNPEWLNQEL